MKVYGDYHTHTIDSDGINTIDENIAAAKKRGLSEVGITDHAHYRARNKKKRLENALLAKAQVLRSGKLHGIKTFYGTECNVVGMDGESAMGKLSSLGLESTLAPMIETTAKLNIIDQFPKAGEEVEKGFLVTLYYEVEGTGEEFEYIGDGEEGED